MYSHLHGGNTGAQLEGDVAGHRALKIAALGTGKQRTGNGEERGQPEYR